MRRREFVQQAAIAAVPLLAGAAAPRRAPLVLATADTEGYVAVVNLAGDNVQQAVGRVLTPSLNHGTVTVLDPDGRVVRHVRVAPAAHDACVVR